MKIKNGMMRKELKGTMKKESREKDTNQTSAAPVMIKKWREQLPHRLEKSMRKKNPVDKTPIGISQKGKKKLKLSQETQFLWEALKMLIMTNSFTLRTISS